MVRPRTYKKMKNVQKLAILCMFLKSTSQNEEPKNRDDVVNDFFEDNYNLFQTLLEKDFESQGKNFEDEIDDFSQMVCGSNTIDIFIELIEAFNPYRLSVAFDEVLCVPYLLYPIYTKMFVDMSEQNQYISRLIKNGVIHPMDVNVLFSNEVSREYFSHINSTQKVAQRKRFTENFFDNGMSHVAQLVFLAKACPEESCQELFLPNSDFETKYSALCICLLFKTSIEESPEYNSLFTTGLDVISFLNVFDTDAKSLEIMKFIVKSIPMSANKDLMFVYQEVCYKLNGEGKLSEFLKRIINLQEPKILETKFYHV